jgi:molybdopterin biosynthesis enzyme
VSTIRLRAPFSVGLAAIGDELTDAASSRDSGCRHDLLSLALEESVAGLGLEVSPFGIAGDHPDEFSSLLLRARDKKVPVLIVTGGLGDGVTDRTLESVKRLDGDVIFQGRLFGCRAGFCLARAHGIDIVGLCGLPLLAAAQLDLFVVPALLARWGASPRIWDWSQSLLPCEAPPTAGGKAPHASTRVLPALLTRGPSGESRIRAWEAETPFLPISGGQEGWAVLPPRGPRAYYCPLHP